ncbi:hypothetical protein OH76DRAFT_439699 [Lentinus brumalis]|uniref:Uncharacterized protein n=1 Tax=Lentinus brumalis TaxID=2498619 RepID=A0A371DE54_9APHY|nr:hypothetical protein OH76DRAFT_439699 [Polyporus brumalis]
MISIPSIVALRRARSTFMAGIRGRTLQDDRLTLPEALESTALRRRRLRDVARERRSSVWFRHWTAVITSMLATLLATLHWQYASDFGSLTPLDNLLCSIALRAKASDSEAGTVTPQNAFAKTVPTLTLASHFFNTGVPQVQ